jgi:hypothetical protein
LLGLPLLRLPPQACDAHRLGDPGTADAFTCPITGGVSGKPPARFAWSRLVLWARLAQRDGEGGGLGFLLSGESLPLALLFGLGQSGFGGSPFQL